jgi:hypothetical protein
LVLKAKIQAQAQEADDDDALLPVLVYIHGGGFNLGTVNVYGKQDMVNLYARRGIVFVQVEYRLGMLGVNSSSYFWGKIYIIALFVQVSAAMERPALPATLVSGTRRRPFDGPIISK